MAALNSIAQNLLAASSALALYGTRSAAPARPLRNGAEKGKTRPDLASCVREVDRSVQTVGTGNNRFVTRYIKVKNSCGVTFKVTLGIAFQADPGCNTLRPG